MGENKTKTKAAMLNELESIKGLLLEEDDIPILQEVIEHKTTSALSPDIPTLQSVIAPTGFDAKNAAKTNAEIKTVFEEQQDFFNSTTHIDVNASRREESDRELLDTISELEKHTAEVTANKFANDNNRTAARPNLAKATGENPFLPEHIRARLHGNNPPPLFENETARKIANSSIPSRQLGNTFSVMSSSANNVKSNNHQQDIIDSIIEKMMPEIEKELREKLEALSKAQLNDLVR